MHTQLKDGVTIVTADSVILTSMEAQIVRQLFANFLCNASDPWTLAQCADTTLEAVTNLRRDLGVSEPAYESD